MEYLNKMIDYSPAFRFKQNVSRDVYTLLHDFPESQQKLHSSHFLLQLHRPDEQPCRHMHFTYPRPHKVLVTAVLKGISASGTSSINSKFSDITCKSAAVNLDANFPSLQPTVYSPSHSAMTTTRKFFESASP
ncbi:hypothetical protein T11_10119 [Trichinella zimbabwensis]|uniref:Uncharacterized protein n=1 Tax=Trichinella zimbabwensis TaxID=268475 RepID=A0A0V1HTK3_9BILA|nr:hypothetical protein T11_10119 [Trichinella zimbabwensis]